MKLSLLIIDGMNLLRRVFEANDAQDSALKADQACSAALHTFKRAVKGTPDFKPTYAVAVFDADGQNWRHTLYADYKAHREPMSPYLRAALPAFQNRLKEVLGLSSLTIAGVEADDVIATLVARWTKDGTTLPGPVIVSSNDKDLFSLSQYGVQFLDVFKREVRTREDIELKLGVTAAQIPDYLALMGDAVDGVPGVPRVGAKTAATLLQEHGNLARVLTAAAEGRIKGKLGESLKTFDDQALLSRALVALRTDVTLGVSWKMLKLEVAHADI